MRMAFWWFISKVKGVECLCVGNVSILHRPSHPIPTPTSRERPAPLTKSGIAVRRELRKSGTLSFLVVSFFISTDADGAVSSQRIATHSPDFLAGSRSGVERPKLFPARQVICCGSSVLELDRLRRLIAHLNVWHEREPSETKFCHAGLTFFLFFFVSGELRQENSFRLAGFFLF